MLRTDADAVNLMTSVLAFLPEARKQVDSLNSFERICQSGLFCLRDLSHSL
jgi:hypothetical protein